MQVYGKEVSNPPKDEESDEWGKLTLRKGKIVLRLAMHEMFVVVGVGIWSWCYQED